MRKILTLAAAVLTSFSLWAQTTLATFEVTLTADPTSAYASYSDDDATYTCSKVGSNSSSNFYKASNDKYYLKLTGDDGFIQIKLKDGNFAAGDTVFYALNHSQKKTGIGFKFNKSSNIATTDMTAAGTEVIGKYTLTAGDLEDDGSIKMLRASSNTFVNRIYVVRTDAAPVTDPVASVTIAGPTEAPVGYAATYTATTDQTATEYKWFIDGAEQTGATKKTFAFTPAVKGATYAIVCKARNDNNATDEWIASTAINVTGTKLCGELFKATTQGTVTGVIGGTYDTNNGTGDSKKLDKSKYYGVKLAAGSFMAGDVFTINVTTAANTEGSKFMLYADKEGTDLIVDAGSEGYLNVTGELTVTLPAAANGKNSIYLYRENGNTQWNPTFNWFSVTRSCEDSNDATIHSLTVNGNEVAENNGLFEYTLSSSYAEPTVTIAFEIHPLATIEYDLSNPYEMETPDVGDSRGQAFTIIAEDGTKKTYTVQIYKSAELSNDWHLKELSVEGYTLTPEFHPDTLIYHITRPYESANPAASAVTAVTRQEGATFVVNSNSNNFTINVTAENGSENAYVIWIDVAPAVKSLKQVKFANGFDAFIDNTNRTVKAFYLAGEAAPEATDIVAGNGTAGPLSEGKILVTGGDASEVEYTVTLEEVTPFTEAVASTADAGAFDGTEAWVKNGLLLYGNTAGFADGKYVLRRQLKNGDAADDQRVIAGWVRTYFFVGNASKLELANTTKNNAVKYAIDGGAYTETNTNPIVIALEEGNHMIEIVTNQSSGDCNLSAPKLVERTATAISNTEAEIKAVKFIENGQFFIIKNGIKYNANGAIVK